MAFDRKKYMSEYTKEYNKEWYKNNKERHIAHVKVNNQKHIAWYKGLKRDLKCAKCGENHPACLDFHHLDPEKKELTIASDMRRYSKETLLAEIDKCIILCSNCHRKEHYNISRSEEQLDAQ